MEALTLSLTYKSFSNRPLKEVKETNKVDNKKFSMYIENNNGDYEEYTTSEFFPSKTFYSFNSEESNCIDNYINTLWEKEDGINDIKNKIYQKIRKDNYIDLDKIY